MNLLICIFRFHFWLILQYCNTTKEGMQILLSTQKYIKICATSFRGKILLIHSTVGILKLIIKIIAIRYILRFGTMVGQSELLFVNLIRPLDSDPHFFWLSWSIFSYRIRIWTFCSFYARFQHFFSTSHNFRHPLDPRSKILTNRICRCPQHKCFN